MIGRRGRGRTGPGLLGTMARTAVIAGTASSVAGRVSASQQASAQQRRETAPSSTTAPAGAAAGPTVDDLVAQLTKLDELRQAGLLTDAEFEEQKRKLLGR